jgi:cyclomaltodextrinase / maltogenic alpha-amylase / neopullulanase
MPLELRTLLFVLIPVTLAGCGSDGAGPAGPGVPGPVGHAFIYSPPAGAPAVTAVSVRGAFNNWGERAMARQTDGSWRATIVLPDGTHPYKFFINGTWPTDMCNDPTWGHAASGYWIDLAAAGCMDDGHGGQNAVVILGPGPGLVFSHGNANPADVSRAGGRVSVRFRVTRGQVQAASVSVGGASIPMHLQFTNGLQEVWRASLPESATSYGFTLQTADGAQTFGPYTVPGQLFTAVPWVGDAVGYQVFPERFWNGDPANDGMALATDSWHYKATGGTQPYLTEWDGDIGNSHCCHQYFGGDLQGIINRLDHLEQLGVSFLYLNPIFTSGSAHGYDASSFMEVAPNFGDEALLRTLLDAAEARRMRVMWDFVPNHVGVGFWAFQDAVAKGPASDYWGWFNFKVPYTEIVVGNGDHYDAWWGLGSLPRLETRNSQVFDHLMEVTRYWTRFGLHGIRVDVPEEIRNRAAFFSAFRTAAKAIDADVYLVGEVWHRDPSWVQGDQFDALMNYAIGQGVIERFARGEQNGSAAAQEMARLYAEYPEASTAMQFNLISSHDTNRLLTMLGGGNLGGTPGPTALARQRLASAFLYALPGVPVTFQGDECAFLGATAGGRDEHRYPMQWDRCDYEMVAHYAGLAEIRSRLAAIRSPVIRAYQGVGPLLAFYRGEPGAEEVLVILNNAQSPQSLTLPAGGWTDAASGEAVAGSVQVGGLAWRYLLRD